LSLILSHPFRFEGGRAAVVEQGSDEGVAEQIAVLVMTITGERELVPAFGIEDPAFNGVDASDITAGLELFGPDVEIVDIEVRDASPTRQEVIVKYGEP
jgi:hypothetical protein